MKTDKVLLISGVLTSIGFCAVMAGCTIQGEPEDSPEAASSEVVQADAAAGSATENDKDKGTGTGTGTGSTPPPAPATDAGTTAKDGGGDAANKDGGATAKCLDDTAPAALTKCPTIGAGDQCVGSCANFDGSWKKGLSDDIRKCLTAAICQAGTATCSDKALAKACVDPTAATFCTPNVTGCKGANAADTLTQASCEGIAKGLTVAGRANLRTCFEQEFNCGDCVAKFK